MAKYICRKGVVMQEKSNTRYFQAQKEPETKVTDIIDMVYLALTEKGYDPVSFLVQVRSHLLKPKSITE